jgi:hypothetical protein
MPRLLSELAEAQLAVHAAEQEAAGGRGLSARRRWLRGTMTLVPSLWVNL